MFDDFPSSLAPNPSYDAPLVVGVMGNCDPDVTGVIEVESGPGLWGTYSSWTSASGKADNLLHAIKMKKKLV